MEKYYTPQMDEFHVGFEYEYQENFGEDFVKKAFTKWEEKEYHSWVNVSNIHPDCLAPIMYRVKYLDKEDIESLGFELEVVECGEDTEHDELGIKRIGGSAYIGTFYTTNNVNVEENIELFNCHFRVKNKSELKVLMKQLNLIK